MVRQNDSEKPPVEPDENSGSSEASEVSITEKNYETITSLTSVKIERPVYQLAELYKETRYEKPKSTIRSRWTNYCKTLHPVDCFLSSVPLIKWLPEYDWKGDFLSDVISGFTVAIMHIPQGLGYAMLGNVPPIMGIYMAFFPVLVYFFFGTSRHISLGTFAIGCLLTGNVVSDWATIEVMQNGTTRLIENTQLRGEDVPQVTNVQVAITVTFVVAIVQIIMYLLRLGAVTNLFSDTLVSGYICAAVFQLLGTQLKDLLGLNVPKRRGNFSFIYTIYDAALAIPNANPITITITAATCACLIINNEIIKPWLSKKTKMPFPVELMVVSIGTAATYFTGIDKTHNVNTVGYIPTGLPEVTVPSFNLIPHIWIDSIVVAIISYAITMSCALIFSRKLFYEIDPNQELLALGISNTVGSFFCCMPVTAALSRSLIQEAVGGVTQLASVVSGGLLLVVLLWLGPAFQTLPRCVLASIICVALKNMFLQFTTLPQRWRLSRWDGFLWAVTFSVTLFVQMTVGLAAGIVASLICIAAQGLRTRALVLGRLEGTDLYMDRKRHKGTTEISGLKIVHFVGGLSFASQVAFKELFAQKVGFDPSEVLRRRAKKKLKRVETEELQKLNTMGIIIDFSSLTFLDPSGVAFLRQLESELDKLGIALYIAGCSGDVYETIRNCDRWEKKNSDFSIFPTVHDAVLFAQGNLLEQTQVQIGLNED